MQRIVLVLLAMVMLSGCASHALNFAKKEGQTDEEFFLAKQYCKNHPIVPVYPFSNAVDYARSGARYNNCMKAKGYTVQEGSDYMILK